MRRQQQPVQSVHDFAGKGVGLYPGSNGKSLEGLKPTNDMIRSGLGKDPSRRSVKSLEGANMDAGSPGKR